jgi:hypothetical protein
MSADNIDDDFFATTDSCKNRSHDTVWVYQPIHSQYGHKLPPNYINDLTSSFIGGKRSIANTPVCPLCSDILYPLVQFYNSVQQYSIRVYACNRPPCVRSLFHSPYNQQHWNGLHYGGNGVVVGHRHVVNDESKKATVTAAICSSTDEDWTTTTKCRTADVEVEESMDWKDDNYSNTNLELDELESQLAAIETGDVSIPKKKTKSIKRTSNHILSTDTSNQNYIDGFLCYLLHGLREPLLLVTTNQSSRAAINDDDLDDVGLSGGSCGGSSSNNNNDQKIQQMLRQYMNEIEDDEELLNILRQQHVSESSSSTCKTSAGNNGGSSMVITEMDERLSIMDRTLFTYTDRLKRIPRQVLRHGGTVPLWSM